MDSDRLDQLCKPERLLGDVRCDLRGLTETIVHFDPKLGRTLKPGIPIESVHPAFVGAVATVMSSGQWMIPLLEWAADLYVALRMRRVSRSISVRLFDFTSEALAIRDIQQRINNLRLAPPAGFSPANLPERFSGEIITALELFTRDQARVFAALERWERSAAAPSTLVPRRLLGRVLHAEDDALTAFLVRAIVEEISTEFQWVGNGRDAVDAFAQRYYDFVILDFHMPMLDGMEAATEILKRSPELHTGTTPALILLSNSVAEDVDLPRAEKLFQRIVSKDRCLDLQQILLELALHKAA